MVGTYWVIEFSKGEVFRTQWQLLRRFRWHNKYGNIVKISSLDGEFFRFNIEHSVIKVLWPNCRLVCAYISGRRGLDWRSTEVWNVTKVGWEVWKRLIITDSEEKEESLEDLMRLKWETRENNVQKLRNKFCLERDSQLDSWIQEECSVMWIWEMDTDLGN